MYVVLSDKEKEQVANLQGKGVTFTAAVRRVWEARQERIEKGLRGER